MSVGRWEALDACIPDAVEAKQPFLSSLDIANVPCHLVCLPVTGWVAGSPSSQPATDRYTVPATRPGCHTQRQQKVSPSATTHGASPRYS
eukprot:350834-Chlamydomonas_euryale.AAC.9